MEELQYFDHIEKYIDGAEKNKKQSTEWYLVLAYLQNGKMEAAEQLMESILQQPNHPNQEKVTLLKEQMGSFWRKWVWQ